MNSIKRIEGVELYDYDLNVELEDVDIEIDLQKITTGKGWLGGGNYGTVDVEEYVMIGFRVFIREKDITALLSPGLLEAAESKALDAVPVVTHYKEEDDYE